MLGRQNILLAIAHKLKIYNDPENAKFNITKFVETLTNIVSV